MKNKVKPVKHYRSPDYPTKEQAVSENTVSALPRRWQRNTAVTALFALCVSGAMVGCSEGNDNNKTEIEPVNKPDFSQYLSNTEENTVPSTIKSITTEGTRIRYLGGVRIPEKTTEEDVSSILRSSEKTQKPIDTTTTTKSITTESPFVTYAGTSPYPKNTTEEDVSLMQKRSEESK